MAALTQVASSEALLEVIAKSGLLSAPAFAQAQAGAAKTADPKQLARDLVKLGTLTAWQANQLLYGRQWLLVGKYKLLDQVSASDIGRVYLAEHAQMGRRHLLKVLSKRHASDPAAVKRFVTEAQQACSLDHRNISHVYDVNQDSDWHFVVMEHVEGENLASLVESSGPLPLPEALESVRQAIEGLNHAHAAGVVHGDLKPTNLLRDASGTIKILDIGQAGLMGSPAAAAGVDETGEMPVVSASLFRAPEVVAGNPAERASDIYSLGSVLCFLLTAKVAANAAAAVEQLRALANVPPELADACARLMAEQPGERPATVLDAWNLLAEAASKFAVAEDVDGIGQIVADDEPARRMAKAGGNGSPFSSLVITPRTREVKQPAEVAGKLRSKPEAKPAAKLAVAKALPVRDDPLASLDPLASVDPLANLSAANEGEVLANSAAYAPPETTHTPLIIAGVLGGIGVLVIALVAVVWMLTANKGETKVAEAKPPVVAAAKSIPAPPSPESNPVVGETNPEANPESNPEVNPGAPAPPPPPPANADQPSDSTTKKKKRGKSSTPPAPADTPAPEPAAPEAKPETPTEPKAASAEPKSDAKPAAKPPEKAPPAKAVPKAPPSPFRGFTAAVALPELPEAAGQPPGDALAPQSLGPCKLDAKAPLEITLKGGATANRDRKLSFELAPQNAKPREWEFVLNGGDAPVQIATLSAKDDSVVFQWTEKAVEQPQPARYLCNCVLELSSGTNQHRAALRLPIEAEPLVVEVERRGGKVQLPIPDLPHAKLVFVEVAKVEGFKKIRVDPDKPANPGELITVWTGPDDKTPLLALRIETSTSTRVLTVGVTPHVKLEEGSKSTRAFSKKDLNLASNQVTQEYSQLQTKAKVLKEMKDKRSPPPKGMSAKDLDDYMKVTLPAELAKRQAQLENLKFLNEFASKDTEPKIHFRVFHETEDGQIDLLKTYVDAPAKGKKK